MRNSDQDGYQGLTESTVRAELRTVWHQDYLRDPLMKISSPRDVSFRKGVSGILGSIIMFSMVFTVGIGFFVYTNQTSLQTLQAGQVRQAAAQQASAEKLVIKVSLASLSDPWGNTGDLWLRVTNAGSVPVTLVDVFVTSTALKVLASKSVITGSAYLQSRSALPAQHGDLNFSLPLALPAGYSTNQLKGCGASVGCDIGISKSSSPYGGTPVLVSVLTSSGNIFSAQYPPPPTAATTTSASTTSYATTTTVTSGNPGGAVLVVQMVATPAQTFSCTACVYDTVTVYNYGTSPVTGVALTPNPPLISSTGNLIITSNGPCTTGGSTSIPAYSGSGKPKSIVFTCNFGANPNGFGGFASFQGSASGTYNLSPVTSGVALSNTIQVGGPINVLNQGPFSANFFFYKYSACTNAPPYSSHCTTTPKYPVAFSSLNNANSITGSSSYYVAFYAQVTNNFNQTIAILPYTYFQVDATVGADSPFFLVGNPSGLPYIPNYNPGGNNVPTLTPYPTTCIATSTSTCINVAPGQTVTLTFAACDISSTYWDWAGHSYGSSFDSGNTCTTSPPSFSSNLATYGSMIIAFPYNGQVYTQDVPFVGLLIN